MPAFDLFPFDTWARLQARFWRNPPADCLGYGDPAGEARLRELIAAYLRSARGLRCEAEQVIVTHRAQQAISPTWAWTRTSPGSRSSTSTG